MTTIVSNATPLIGLAIIGRFGLLRTLFGEIWITDAVRQELTISGGGRIGSNETSQGIAEGWICVQSFAATETLTALRIDLDDGEAETIALGLESKADLLLIDEHKARAKAKALGLEITGTIGILLLAREKGLERDLQPLLSKLREHGFRISDELYERILKS